VSRRVLLGIAAVVLVAFAVTWGRIYRRPPLLETSALMRERPERTVGPVEGRLMAARLRTYSGCTVPPETSELLFVVRGEDWLPLRVVSSSEFDAIKLASENGGTMPALAGALLEPKDASRLGAWLGQRLGVDGVIAPVLWSGTVGLSPIYGVFIRQSQI
jgi:hypothetical protein